MSGRSSKPKRPRDANQVAKSIVDLTTGDAEEIDPDEGKDPNAVALGRKGGLKGGKARAAKLTKKQRSEIAKKAAFARWGKDYEPTNGTRLKTLTAKDKFLAFLSRLKL